jgi:bacilysin biosynthesis protein BacB
VYVAGTNIPHGSVIFSQETVFGFEMKYLIGSQLDKHIDEPIISLQPTIDKTTGFPCKFGACSWFHIAILEIPANDKLPKCTTNTEEIGIIFNDQILRKVGEEEKLLEYGSVYYAPAGVSPSGYSTSDKAIF